jgi:hypothetical protein
MSEQYQHSEVWTVSAFRCLNGTSILRSEQYQHSYDWTVPAFWTVSASICLNSTSILKSKQYQHADVWTVPAFWSLNSISMQMSEQYQHSEVWIVSAFISPNSIGIHKVRLQTHTYNIFNAYCRDLLISPWPIVEKPRILISLRYGLITIPPDFHLQQCRTHLRSPGRPGALNKSTPSSSSSVWGRRLPTECTAAFRDLLY